MTALLAAPVDWARLALYLVFEFLALLCAHRAVTLLSGGEVTRDGQVGEYHLALLLGQMLIMGLLAKLLTALHLNHAWLYMGCMALLAFMLTGLRPAGVLRGIRSMALCTWGGRPGLWGLAMGVVLTVMLGLGLRRVGPFSEGDSHFYMQFVLDWMHNLRGVNQAPNTHNLFIPVLWQLVNLPSLVVAHTDAFIWWNGFKAESCMVLGVLCISRRLGVHAVAAFTMTLGAVLLHVFWWTNGLGTLKEGVFVAAGTLCAAYAVLGVGRRGANRADVLIFLLGYAAMQAKLNGVLLGGFLGVLAAMAYRKELFPLLANDKRMLAALALLAVAPGLDFLVHQLVEYHNPLYPFALKVGGTVLLPGQVSEPGTTILERLSNPELWRIVFLQRNIASGLFFGLWFVFGLFCLPVTAAWVLVLRQLERTTWRDELGRLLVAAFVSVAMVLYIKTPYSAGWGDVPFGYFHDHASIRYIAAILFLSQMMFVSLLWRFRWGRWLAIPVCLADMGTRGLYLGYMVWANGLETQYAGFAMTAICVVLVLAVAAWSGRFVHPILGPVVLVMALLGILVHYGEAHRVYWAEYAKPASLFFDSAPASRIAIFGGPTFPEYDPYSVSGRYFQHSVDLYDARDLEKVDITDYDYLVSIKTPNVASRKFHDELALRMAAKGGVPFYVDDTVVISVNAPRIDYAQAEARGRGVHPRLVAFTEPKAGGVLEGAGWAEAWEQGGLFVGRSPSCMLLLEGRKVRVVDLPQGTEFTVANIGAFDVRARRVLGQRLVALGGQFVPVSSVRPGGPDFRVAGLPGILDILRVYASPQGPVNISRLQDEQGRAFISLASDRVQDWLMLGSNRIIGELDGVPMYIAVQLSVVGGGGGHKVGLQAFDYHDGKFEHNGVEGMASAGELVGLSLNLLVREPSANDYFVAGLVGAGKGESCRLYAYDVGVGVFPFGM